MNGDLGGFPMLDLFRVEVDSQAHVLTSGLLALERHHGAADQLEACMRAAHSMKGAARIVNLAASVRVAHAMEDCFVAAQQRRLLLQQRDIDVLLAAVDLLTRIAATSETEMDVWAGERTPEVDACVRSLAAILHGEAPPSPASPVSEPFEPSAAPESDAAPDPHPLQPPPAAAPLHAPLPAHAARGAETETDAAGRALRITAENLDRLLALAGESLVASRWVKPFAESLVRLNRLQGQSSRLLERAREMAPSAAGAWHAEVVAAERALAECRRVLADRLAEIETFDRRTGTLSQRLYDEAVACRMRPFAEGTGKWPRLVRDVARTLGKQVRLDIRGAGTAVDRDILRDLDTPLGHLLRNAIDHGIETPDDRRAAGKPEEGVILVEACHRAGLLQIAVSDDGRGVDLVRLRARVVERGLVGADAAAALSDAELLAFLFLPGFTLTKAVTDMSGRGVGLDAVQDMVRRVRGTVRVFSEPGRGTTFQLQLPVTLSVIRALVVEIGGEPYAFPLAAIVRAIRVQPEAIDVLEGRPHIDVGGRRVGLLWAHHVLGVPAPVRRTDGLAVVILGDGPQMVGLVVDRLMRERELVVRPLDASLGKIQDIAAGAIMEDGTPVLIVDADDLVRTMAKMASAEAPGGPDAAIAAPAPRTRKRVLVVDDSLTVRELERKLLVSRGYEVEVAVDGMEGWNAVRSGRFQLVITDIDMPRMDGIELVTLITRDPQLRSLPVMVVSYKDRDDDRRRGLEAGAARYLTKGSFHDETLVEAVTDLIGGPEA
jgi:two-component system sensor histidine kinase and response regulator WspE